MISLNEIVPLSLPPSFFLMMIGTKLLSFKFLPRSLFSKREKKLHWLLEIKLRKLFFEKKKRDLR